jgi:hypothetical protein
VASLTARGSPQGERIERFSRKVFVGGWNIIILYMKPAHDIHILDILQGHPLTIWICSFLVTDLPNFPLPPKKLTNIQIWRIERFSRKVFVGGLPPDIDEGKIKPSKL